MNVHRQDLIRLIGKTLILSCVIFVVSAGLIFFTFFFLKIPFEYSKARLVLIFFVSITTVCTYKYVETVLQGLIEKHFSRVNVSSSRELRGLNEKIISILDLTELANLVVNTVSEVFHIKNVSLLTLNDDIRSYKLASSYGFNITETSQLSLPHDDILLKAALKTKRALSRDTLIKSLLWHESSLVCHSFVKLYAYYIFPIIFNGTVIGLLNLNKKKSNKNLSRREIEQIESFLPMCALALNNSRTFSSLKRITDDLKSVQSHLLQSAKMSAIEQLAAGIAHEIHNPLTIISGKAQVLLLKGSKKVDQERVNDVLQTIVQQTKRAAEITRRLLMFAKPQSDDSNRFVNIESVINDTISLVSYQISLDDIRIVKVIESNIPHIIGSVVEVRELLLSLMLNAIQAIGKKGVITVTLQHVDKDGLIKISIADTGIGIPDEHIPYIFDPFYTTRRDRVGLGLFVCQQIVNRLGGAIKVESKIGVGTAFMVMMRVQQLSQHHSPVSESEQNTRSALHNIDT
ncbi:MAG: hypothetical protein KKH94_11900 [Candidatus Omnitrophica bacterium]|nr:hypothetical protein [Candidatus Omnitrophota bacterium]